MHLLNNLINRRLDARKKSIDEDSPTKESTFHTHNNKTATVNRHLKMMKRLRDKSQERSLQSYENIEESWNKFSRYVNKKIKRPDTSASLIEESNLYCDK